ncbi:MAG: hypothetical protein H6R18_1744 [Proteobacteria bacterium]|nr:hypothetical protein [Pseudomonadota bacterium]
MRFLWIFFLTIGLAQAAQNRVALIIGNASYPSSPLTNPVNDARAMDAKLRVLGFKTVLRENLTQKQIGSALREFRANLSPGAEALFFYAGHGLQIKGVNYLPAVDADISAEEDVPTQSIDVNKVLEIMEESKTRINLIFLDACRNNPYSRRFRSQDGGLAKMSAPSGTIISFATRPGSVAADGEGSNGLYTEHLLKAMVEPGIPIEQVLKKVLIAVKKASRGKQEPWLEGGIEGEFYFIGVVRIKPQAAALPTTTAVDPTAIELSFWDSIKSSQDRSDFEEYLHQYPQGRFAGLAKNRLKSTAAANPAETEKRKPASEPATKTTNKASDLTPFWQDRINKSAPADTQARSPANDEKLAASLVGKWEGMWKSSGSSHSGKLNTSIRASDGIHLKGRSDWLSTTAGDFELDFVIAKIKDSKLSVTYGTGGLYFEADISDNGKSMTGTWSNRQGNAGTLQMKKID